MVMQNLSFFAGGPPFVGTQALEEKTSAEFRKTAVRLKAPVNCVLAIPGHSELWGKGRRGAWAGIAPAKQLVVGYSRKLCVPKRTLAGLDVQACREAEA
eukprot:1161759-Pelagomonas_calceolata.AAC.4